MYEGGAFLIATRGCLLAAREREPASTRGTPNCIMLNYEVRAGEKVPKLARFFIQNSALARKKPLFVDKGSRRASRQRRSEHVANTRLSSR